MRVSTAIYLYLVSGALVVAGLQVVGVAEQVSYVLGFGAIALLVAVVLYRRRKRRSNDSPGPDRPKEGSGP